MIQSTIGTISRGTSRLSGDSTNSEARRLSRATGSNGSAKLSQRSTLTGTWKGLLPRRDVELVLYFLEAERRANRDQLDDVQSRRPDSTSRATIDPWLCATSVTGVSGPGSMSINRWRIADRFAGSKKYAAVSVRNAFRNARAIGSRMNAGHRHHLGAHAAARRQRRLLQPVGPAQLLDVGAGVLVARRDAGLGENGIRLEGLVVGSQAPRPSPALRRVDQNRTNRPSGWPALKESRPNTARSHSSLSSSFGRCRPMPWM